VGGLARACPLGKLVGALRGELLGRVEEAKEVGEAVDLCEGLCCEQASSLCHACLGHAVWARRRLWLEGVCAAAGVAMAAAVAVAVGAAAGAADRGKQATATLPRERRGR